jgi:hypothetical protein
MKSFHPTDELLCHVHGRARCVSWLLALIVMLVFGVASGALAKGDKDSDAGKKSSPYEEQSKKQNDYKKDGDGKHCTSKNCDIKHHNHPKPPKPPKPPKGRNKVLAAPTMLTAQAVSLFQVNLTWADNSTNELGFKIERSSDGRNFTQIAQVLPNTTTYRDLNRFPDTEYFYRVCAFIARGNSTYSTVTRAQTR